MRADGNTQTQTEPVTDCRPTVHFENGASSRHVELPYLGMLSHGYSLDVSHSLRTRSKMILYRTTSFLCREANVCSTTHGRRNQLTPFVNLCGANFVAPRELRKWVCRKHVSSSRVSEPKHRKNHRPEKVCFYRASGAISPSLSLLIQRLADRLKSFPCPVFCTCQCYFIGQPIFD